MLSEDCRVFNFRTGRTISRRHLANKQIRCRLVGRANFVLRASVYMLRDMLYTIPSASTICITVILYSYFNTACK